MTPILRTDRLLLRPAGKRDAEPLFRLIRNFDVAKWLTSVPWPYTREDAEIFVERVSEMEGDTHYIICVKDRLAGCISCGAQLGYWIGEPYWGNGYMTEATHAVIREYFGDNHADLSSGYHAGNEKSRRILEKLGFTPTEVISAGSRVMERVVSIQRMRLSRASWEARQ